MPDKDTYSEFECLTTNSNIGTKKIYQEHKPCGYMLNVVSSIDNTYQPYLYRGEDCMYMFVKQLAEIKNAICDKMNVNKPMDELNDECTYEQKTIYRNATHCSICNKNVST